MFVEPVVVPVDVDPDDVPVVVPVDVVPVNVDRVHGSVCDRWWILRGGRVGSCRWASEADRGTP